MFMRLIAGVVFVVLLVVLLPLMVLGAALVIYKQMVVSRRLGARDWRHLPSRSLVILRGSRPVRLASSNASSGVGCRPIG